jgi:hypothetical protein
VSSIKEKVQTSLSEGRNLVLGAQILLGFQYNAAFHPGFERLAGHTRWAEAATLGLLLVTMLLLLAPAPFHRIAEGGEATPRQHRYTNQMIASALVPFALALGSNVFIATERPFGTGAALTLGLTMGAAALAAWFGPELVRASSGRDAAMHGSPTQDRGGERTSLKEKINHLLTESRIILPGAQALLGFQFAAFLTDAFEKLPQSSKLAGPCTPHLRPCCLSEGERARTRPQSANATDPSNLNAMTTRRRLFRCDGSLASAPPHPERQLRGSFSRKAGLLAFGDVTFRFDHNHVATLA